MRIRNLSRFAVFSVIGSITLMPLLVLPAMIGVLVDRAGMSESLAGWSASLNFLGSAVIGLLMSLRIHHLSLRRVGMAALALAIIADLASAVTAGPTTTFLAVRTIAGIVLGAAYVTAASSFARFDDYERGFGLFVTLQFIISGLGLYVVPVYSEALGARGLFVSFAILDALALILARYLPAEIAAVGRDKDSKSEIHVLLTLAAILGIVGFALFEGANNAQFTYIERFGVSLNISDHNIGIALLIASLIGIPGAFTIVVIGHRFGTLGPLTLGIAIAILGLYILIESATYFWYFFGSCLMGFSWAYCLPYIQSLLAALDRNGSAIAAGTSLSTLGDAVGPGAAALVVGGGRYVNVFGLSIALFVITYACFFYAGRHRAGATEVRVSEPG
jgi:predicted MFS family arabinose efflux permease